VTAIEWLKQQGSQKTKGEVDNDKTGKEFFSLLGQRWNIFGGDTNRPMSRMKKSGMGVYLRVLSKKKNA